jgi:hypothetical protein
MAVTHVVACFPQLNNLHNFELVRRRNVLAMDAQTRELVGDGGFRPARAGQSARSIHLEDKADDAAPSAGRPRVEPAPSQYAQSQSQQHGYACKQTDDQSRQQTQPQSQQQTATFRSVF